MAFEVFGLKLVAIVGPSGCGKSTVLDMIGGRHRDGARRRAGRDAAAAVAAGVPSARVKRWAWLLAGLIVVVGLVALGAARLAGRRGSRPSAVISVVTMWLAAWVLWGFAGGLAAQYGALTTYDSTLFTVVAVAGGVWQYRTQVRQGRQQGLAVFVAAQLLWLAVVLWQNGVLIR
jgi:energy-coupling factor transporter ATP-binding protein EcfA2